MDGNINVFLLWLAGRETRARPTVLVSLSREERLEHLGKLLSGSYYFLDNISSVTIQVLTVAHKNHIDSFSPQDALNNVNSSV